MTTGDRPEVYRLLAARPDASAEAPIGAALALFDERPDYGFVWVAVADDVPSACALVSFAISTRVGAAVARIDEFAVEPADAPGFLASLLAEVRRIGYGEAEALGAEAEAPGLLASGFTWSRRAVFARSTRERVLGRG